MSGRARVVALVHGEGDLAAVRAAVALGETTVIALAPPGDASEVVLRAARALGAARTVRMWDDAVASTDYLGVAFTLAATVRAVMGELTTAPGVVIVCGDAGRGAVGPAVAERLGLPHLSQVIAIAHAPDGEARVIATRRSGEAVRAYAGQPPVVVCVVPDGKPAPGEGGAGTTEVWTLGQAGITAAEVAYRKRFRPQPEPGPAARPRVFDDAGALAARLRADGVVPGASKKPPEPAK